MKRMSLGLFLFFAASSQTQAAQPLASTNVKQYQCIVRGYPSLAYFNPRMPPEPIRYTPGGRVICHDVVQYGQQDSVLFPRLDEKDASYKLWNSTDPRWYDNNGDRNADINEEIYQLITNLGGRAQLETKWFQRLNNLGYVMRPFMDPTTYISYCPTAVHYNSSNPVFKALREVLGVDTEGLYIGQRTTGLGDFMLIGEAELKKTWFYLRNGVPTIPTEDLSSKMIFFTYKGKTFQVTSLAELSWDSSYPTHDKKIGCVPKQ